ncbi:MAG: hypothetical protein NWE77_02820 [Candidatus Bathyarchaeota archaeon]|nr:hypothetical protein [Candidatus Bathyarchaeota archaeon]
MILTAENLSSLDVLQEIKEKEVLDPYRNSPLFGLKKQSAKSKGAAIEKLVSEILTGKGHAVTTGGSSDYDRKVDGVKVEIKGSFLWGSGTHFRWQQIRPAQDYDIICFVALFPDRVELYGATHEQCKKHLDVQDSNGHWPYNQHGGKTVRSGTFCIDVKPDEIPSWFKKLEELL